MLSEDEIIAEMIQKIKDEFGTAEEETVTENSYSFKNRTKNMKEDLDFIRGENARENRMYVKKKHGWD